MVFRCIFWGVLMLTGSVFSTGAQELPCTGLIGATAAGNLEYLQRDRALTDPICTAFAIRELGRERYLPAVPALVKALDFKAPETLPQPARPIRPGPITWVGSVYPAANALFQIGKAVVPALLDAIASPKTTDLVVRNVIELLVATYREDPAEAVTVLVHASRARTDHVASQRLWEAAERVSLRCVEPSRNRCLEALR